MKISALGHAIHFRIRNEPDKIDLCEVKNTLKLCEVIIELNV